MLILLVVGVWHLFRVRRDGGIAVPPPALRISFERIKRKELIRREVLAMLWAMLVLLILAILIPAPLAPAIQPGSTSNSENLAPWFFLWVQQLLIYGDPFIYGILVPLGVVLLVAIIPYLTPRRHSPSELGRWFPHSGRIIQWLIAALSSLILLLTILALIT
jgi:hypothetical protein